MHILKNTTSSLKTDNPYVLRRNLYEESELFIISIAGFKKENVTNLVAKQTFAFIFENVEILAF